jgi:hypothetical protein
MAVALRPEAEVVEVLVVLAVVPGLRLLHHL